MQTSDNCNKKFELIEIGFNNTIAAYVYVSEGTITQQ